MRLSGAGYFTQPFAYGDASLVGHLASCSHRLDEWEEDEDAHSVVDAIAAGPCASFSSWDAMHAEEDGNHQTAPLESAFYLDMLADARENQTTEERIEQSGDSDERKVGICTHIKEDTAQ